MSWRWGMWDTWIQRTWVSSSPSVSWCSGCPSWFQRCTGDLLQCQVGTHTILVETELVRSLRLCMYVLPQHPRCGADPPLPHVLWQADGQTLRISWKYACRADASPCHPFCSQWCCWQGSTWGQSEHYRHLSSCSYWINSRMNNVKSVYKTLVDVTHYGKMDAKRLHEGDEEAEQNFYSEKHVELLKELSRKPDIYERFAQPQLQTFKNRQISKRKSCFSFSREQGRILVTQEWERQISCWDQHPAVQWPGTSKSQLLQCGYSLILWDQYIPGGHSSTADLRAYVVKDPERKQLALQTGALSLRDSGICCTDTWEDEWKYKMRIAQSQRTADSSQCSSFSANPIESQCDARKHHHWKCPAASHVIL